MGTHLSQCICTMYIRTYTWCYTSEMSLVMLNFRGVTFRNIFTIEVSFLITCIEVSFHILIIEVSSPILIIEVSSPILMSSPIIIIEVCLINPRRACAARVTVLSLCVCLSLCLSVCLMPCFLNTVSLHVERKVPMASARHCANYYKKGFRD